MAPGRWGVPQLRDFRVVLSRPQGVFLPGETVTGELLLSTSAPLPCRSLCVHLTHKATAEWGELAPVSLERESGSSASGAAGVRAAAPAHEFQGATVYAAATRSLWGSSEATE